VLTLLSKIGSHATEDFGAEQTVNYDMLCASFLHCLWTHFKTVMTKSSGMFPRRPKEYLLKCRCILSVPDELTEHQKSLIRNYAVAATEFPRENVFILSESEALATYAVTRYGLRPHGQKNRLLVCDIANEDTRIGIVEFNDCDSERAKQVGLATTVVGAFSVDRNFLSFVAPKVRP
jgi:hypothetical protein